MRARKRRIIELAALAITVAAMPLAHAEARQPRHAVEGLGSTSSQQARITLSVAPTFKPRLQAEVAGNTGSRLCLSSNVDAQTFDLVIAASAAPPGQAHVAASRTMSADGSAACVSLADLPHSSTGAPTHQMIIVSPR